MHVKDSSKNEKENGLGNYEAIYAVCDKTKQTAKATPSQRLRNVTKHRCFVTMQLEK